MGVRGAASGGPAPGGGAPSHVDLLHGGNDEDKGNKGEDPEHEGAEGAALQLTLRGTGCELASSGSDPGARAAGALRTSQSTR